MVKEFHSWVSDMENSIEDASTISDKKPTEPKLDYTDPELHTIELPNGDRLVENTFEYEFYLKYGSVPKYNTRHMRTSVTTGIDYLDDDLN